MSAEKADRKKKIMAASHDPDLEEFYRLKLELPRSLGELSARQEALLEYDPEILMHEVQRDHGLRDMDVAEAFIVCIERVEAEIALAAGADPPPRIG